MPSGGVAESSNTNRLSGNSQPISGLDAAQRRQYQVRRFDVSRSFVSSIRAFPTNIEVRNAQQEQALTQYERTVLTAFGEVEKSLVSYAQEQVRYRSLSQAVAANRRAAEMANELYIRGLEDYLNVLDAQRALFLTETERAQSEATMAANLVALYKALGGGWEIR